MDYGWQLKDIYRTGAIFATDSIQKKIFGPSYCHMKKMVTSFYGFVVNYERPL